MTTTMRHPLAGKQCVNCEQYVVPEWATILPSGVIICSLCRHHGWIARYDLRTAALDTLEGERS